MKERKTLLSTLWVFVTLNYLYCDLIGLMDAHLLKQYLAGKVDGIRMDPPFLLAAGILMEIPIAMVLLSRLLPYKMNAWMNMAAGFLKTMVMILTFFVGKPSVYYVFFATIEIGTTLFIAWYAIDWLRRGELSMNVTDPY